MCSALYKSTFLGLGKDSLELGINFKNQKDPLILYLPLPIVAVAQTKLTFLADANIIQSFTNFRLANTRFSSSIVHVTHKYERREIRK